MKEEPNISTLTVSGLGSSILFSSDFAPAENQYGKEKSAELTYTEELLL